LHGSHRAERGCGLLFSKNKSLGTPSPAPSLARLISASTVQTEDPVEGNFKRIALEWKDRVYGYVRDRAWVIVGHRDDPVMDASGVLISRLALMSNVYVSAFAMLEAITSPAMAAPIPDNAVRIAKPQPETVLIKGQNSLPPSTGQHNAD